MPLIYPFVSEEGPPINVWNAEDIVVRYCREVLGADYDPRHIFPCDDINGWDGHVRFPCFDENGEKPWVEVTLEQVAEIWGGLPLSKALPADDLNLLKGRSEKDRARRRACYATAVFMRRRGLLDRHNEPAVRAVTLARVAVGPTLQTFPSARGVNIPNSVRPANGALTTAKVVLHTFVQQKCPSGNIGEKMFYESEQGNGGLWRSKLTVAIGLKDMVFFSAEAANKKREAELLAAMAACSELGLSYHVVS